MKVALIGLALAQALGRRAFGGYAAEVAAGIEGAAGIMDEDVVQRVTIAAQRGLEFFAGAKRRHLAQMHDRDAIAITLRLLQVMGREKQRGAVVSPQIDQMFPDRVARNRIQPDGRSEEHTSELQSPMY